MYGADRAIAQNDHGPEPTASFELYESEDFMQSEGPGFRQWPDERDHALPRVVTKRRSRVRFASPPSDERLLTELPATVDQASNIRWQRTLAGLPCAF